MRDKKNIKELAENGWNVIVIWQCDLRSAQNRTLILDELISELNRLK